MSDTEEKALPPTARKLRDARRRGEVARSKEWATAVVTAIAVLALVFAAPYVLGEFRTVLLTMSEFEKLPLKEAVGRLTWQLAKIGASLLLPLIAAVVGGAVIASIVGSGGLNFSATPLSPKLDRLDPIEGFKRLFKLRSLLELVKTSAKLVLVIALSTFLLRGEVGAWMELPACGLICVPRHVSQALVPLLLASAIAFLVIGLLDILLQRWLFLRDMRMGKTEHKRDRKNAEGDPQRLGERRRARLEDAKLGARTGLRHATFVTRSRDIALAFRYHPPDTMVPMLVARARGDSLARFLAEARRRNLPSVDDQKGVETISRGLEVGKMIKRADFATIIQWMKATKVLR